jgi:hypothetical protein
VPSHVEIVDVNRKDQNMGSSGSAVSLDVLVRRNLTPKGGINLAETLLAGHESTAAGGMRCRYLFG